MAVQIRSGVVTQSQNIFVNQPASIVSLLEEICKIDLVKDHLKQNLTIQKDYEGLIYISFKDITLAHTCQNSNEFVIRNEPLYLSIFDNISKLKVFI